MRTPRHIEIDRTAQTLTLHWPDGVTQHVAHRVLRQHCPCAECKRLRLRGDTPLVPDDIAVLDVRPAGYGVQLLFSDSHERGIFPWAFLERLPATA
ncbi:gamma-butyrobetaine hydroxylase-like domain-containing protein [Paraburkholderia sp. PGU16]|uniref:Gamma-butyrobetaine hydroxylase-like N-terminal domain-containing protein n=1 Tax=Paraburkholderia largidicola TaxID=3014751 RepID=A0A7I8BZB9_9BURK|nr:gamma-butyrobetaine hydroxylase-like domain-containing protein [Paraburkholderia sp. PGU16]BCF93983.1 hypothetical protein PPGU16_70500 [Paraburkholderia sp. PGU16]BEU27153.1 gamma-butyrobetaine hydroxylase-like domain-containing protein [Paraburkholderia sp. 22B1P]